MRLIDADALEKIIDDLSKRGWTDWALSVRKVIDEQPTVDAVPVKHGLWTIHEEGFSHEECGYFVDDNFFTPYHREKVNSWKYCPRCGAKMDGERRESE